MYLDSVCIYNSVVTAHRRKIKTSFVHEFTVNYSVVYLVILSPTGKCICKKRCFFTENLVFLQPDDIACSVFLTLLIEIRSCKTTIAAKQEMDALFYSLNK